MIFSLKSHVFFNPLKSFVSFYFVAISFMPVSHLYSLFMINYFIRHGFLFSSCLLMLVSSSLVIQTQYVNRANV